MIRKFLLSLLPPSFDAIRLNEAQLCSNCETITNCMGASKCPICGSAAVMPLSRYIQPLMHATADRIDKFDAGQWGKAADQTIARVRRRSFEEIYKAVESQ